MENVEGERGGVGNVELFYETLIVVVGMGIDGVVKN